MKPSGVDRLARVLAVWFGCGLVPLAPGTVGTLGALPVLLVVRPFGPAFVLAAALLLTAVGVWAASRVVVQTGQKDPQIVVIDEVAGVLFTWAAAPSVRAIVIGFVLFRIFDQLKPWPARLAERRLPGGWGVVLDDVAAGIWGAVVLLALSHWGCI